MLVNPYPEADMRPTIVAQLYRRSPSIALVAPFSLAVLTVACEGKTTTRLIRSSWRGAR